MEMSKSSQSLIVPLLSTTEKSTDFYLKLPTKREQQNWNRKEKYVWFFTLLFGTTAVYACRTTMPLVAPNCAKSLKWSKTEVGTILSSFFWGYCLTQILGGFLSDRFGAERVLLTAGLIWGLLTFWFQTILSMDMSYVVFSRVLLGAAQGVHFPALASISSRNLNTKDRSFFFSATTAGGAFGTLLTGTLGSYMNETFGWESVFYSIGFIALLWVALLKYYAMMLTSQKTTIVGMSTNTNLSNSNVTSGENNHVPWLTYLTSPALWACIFCHFCQNNCFFILLSWLPTYFHDNFPEAKSWIFNVVPWLLMVPGIGLASLVSNYFHHKGYSTGATRKICEAICMVTEALCLISIGYVRAFSWALLLCTLALFAKSFHNFGTPVNALDIAPKHSGSVFGIINAIASTSGFVGVYLAGYILELSGSWSAVFNVTAVINICGIIVFSIFGSGNPIV